MASVKYDIEVQVSRVSVSRLLSEYWNPDPVREACKLCPDYGKVWSCPPGVPEADDYLKPFREGFLIAVKVKYPEETRTLAVSAAKAQEIRNQTYEKVKRNLLLTLLELEKEFPGGICIGAGRCILCSHCARQDGESCRYPKLRRYSITAFGFVLQEWSVIFLESNCSGVRMDFRNMMWRYQDCFIRKRNPAGDTAGFFYLVAITQ